MREFSNEELTKNLATKVRELKEAKSEVEELNEKLQDNMAKLEETQQELSYQNEELEKTVQEKTKQLLSAERLSTVGEFSSRIAHDLKNPLSVIKNATELLRFDLEPITNENTKTHLAMLDRAIYRMSHQVDDVLDYVSPSKLNIIENSLQSIISNSLKKIDVPPNIMLNLPNSDIIIPCDSEKIQILFVNLLSNSIQAIDNKHGTISITFDEIPNEHFVEIKVFDDGPGIPSELIEKIFDPLFTTRQIGTGLGLPTCKSIAERHDGSLILNNNDGKGAHFVLRLPLESEFDLIGREFDLPKPEKLLANS